MPTAHPASARFPKALLLLLALAATASAQPERAYLMQTIPHPIYPAPDNAVYNLKYGRLVAKVAGGVQAEFNDNINLANTGREADLSIGPTLNVGFLYPTSRDNILQLEFEGGYRWYLRNGGVSFFNVAPRTRVDYRVFWEDVQLSIHDSVMVTSDPTSYAQVGGGPRSLVHFNRFINDAGVSADWRPLRDWGFLGSYNYTIDRSLTSDFTSLDRDVHAFTAGAYHVVNPRLTIGGNATYSITLFRDDYQNNGWGFTVGPWFTYKATRFLNFDGSCGWSTTGYDTRGRIGDANDFNGFTWQLGARHIINSRMSHNLRGGRSVGIGIGSNFTDTWLAQYGFDWKVGKKVSLHTLLSYENYNASSALADSGWRVLYYASLGFPVHRRWYGAVSYSYALKDSRLAGSDYYQNRLTVDLRYQF